MSISDKSSIRSTALVVTSLIIGNVVCAAVILTLLLHSPMNILLMLFSTMWGLIMASTYLVFEAILEDLHRRFSSLQTQVEEMDGSPLVLDVDPEEIKDLNIVADDGSR